MVPVYVRHENQERGTLLGRFPPGEIDGLVALFNRYPTYDEREGDEGHVALVQFVVDASHAYFEIVVGPQEEPEGG